MEAVKQHLNFGIIIITNPLKTIKKLIPLNIKSRLEIKTIRAIATDKMEHRTPHNFMSVRFKNMKLYLTEKLQIFRADPKKLLNKRSELVSKYRHRRWQLLNIFTNYILGLPYFSTSPLPTFLISK